MDLRRVAGKENYDQIYIVWNSQRLNKNIFKSKCFISKSENLFEILQELHLACFLGNLPLNSQDMAFPPH